MTNHRGAEARYFAWKILVELDSGSTLLELNLQQALDKSALNQHDQRLAERIIKGTLEERASVDAAISRYLRGELKKLSPELRAALRIGAYQIQHLDRVRPEAAVNQTVELAKKVTNRFEANLVNAVLRKIVTESQRAEPPAELRTAEQVAMHFSHPLWLVERWCAQIGLEETTQLCAYNNQRQPVSIRLNRLMGSDGPLLEQIAAEGVELESGEVLHNCFSITAISPHRRLSDLKSFKNGLFTIQDESSAMVAKALDPLPGELLVDLCAAPGGKTAYLAELMSNQGRIIAVDLHENRLAQVREGCARLGVEIVTPVVADGTSYSLDGVGERAADRVLVDAPCSGLGTVGRKKDLRWNRTLEDLEGLYPLQFSLLENAARLVRPGGKIMYSTCSTDQGENEQIVDRFLERHGDFSWAPITTLPSPVLTSRGELRTWPHRHRVGGAYAAVLVRER